jgi:hypothetical protein
MEMTDRARSASHGSVPGCRYASPSLLDTSVNDQQSFAGFVRCADANIASSALVIGYGINSAQNAMMNSTKTPAPHSPVVELDALDGWTRAHADRTTAAPEFKNDPRNPNAKAKH